LLLVLPLKHGSNLDVDRWVIVSTDQLRDFTLQLLEVAGGAGCRVSFWMVIRAPDPLVVRSVDQLDTSVDVSAIVRVLLRIWNDGGDEVEAVWERGEDGTLAGTRGHVSGVDKDLANAMRRRAQSIGDAILDASVPSP
jgi:hypothetical protein